MKALQFPLSYRYADLLKLHIQQQTGGHFKPFDGTLVFPRQFEIHLSNTKRLPCNVKCEHCQGRNLDRVIEPFDDKVFPIIEKLNGRIPMFVLSGAYSEPTLNERCIELIELIKKTGSHFGLHTNGTMLAGLEKRNSFVTRMIDASDKDDYMTLALDAGSPDSFAKCKKVDGRLFDSAIAALRIVNDIRSKARRSTLVVRITYLLNQYNSTEQEIANVVRLMKEAQVDSLRFAVPYDPYGTPLKECLEYKFGHEVPFFRANFLKVKPFISKRQDDKPFIFVMPPETQDVEKIDFHHCFYGYFMINLGAVGLLYRCSAVAAPQYASSHRLGPMTDDIDIFSGMIIGNQKKHFDPMSCCLPHGARCNRASININSMFSKEYFPAVKN